MHRIGEQRCEKTSKIAAEARKTERTLDAAGHIAWLANDARVRIEVARLNPLSHLIAQVRSAVFGEN